MSVVVVGSINIDLALQAPRLPLPGETLSVQADPPCVGGKGANQAVALARLGVMVTMIGMVGDDAEGDLALAALRREGVTVPDLRRSSERTGTAVVLRESNGQSTILLAAGANADLSAHDVDAFAEVLKTSACLLLQLEIGDAPIVGAIASAQGLVVLNPAPARPLPESVLSRVDVLVPNQLELSQLCGSDEAVNDISDLAAMARSIAGPQAVVVTLGERGCLVCAGGATAHLPPPHHRPIDTTGAGDSFCGALVTALLAGRELTAAAAWANEAAALSVTRPGAMSSLPTLAQLRAVDVAAQELTVFPSPASR